MTRPTGGGGVGLTATAAGSGLDAACSGALAADAAGSDTGTMGDSATSGVGAGLAAGLSAAGSKRACAVHRRLPLSWLTTST